GLRWFAAEIVLDGLDQGHQLTLIVAALRQFVRDNDLGACVDGGLCIIGLNEAILRLHDAAFRIGEVALRLGIRLVRWRRRRFARLLAAFGLALLFLFGLDATLFLRRQPGVGLPRRPRLLDLCQAPLLVARPPPPPCVLGPAASACRRPNPASRRRVCLCQKSRPLHNPPPRRPPACERPRLSIPPRVSSCAHNSSLYVSTRLP